MSGANKKRVAAYIRVSTLRDEQADSLDLQAKHFHDLIKSHQDWQFVKTYIENGRSGTNISSRKAFCEMIKDAQTGKIDLILVKSISRFSRNTLDLLEMVRTLKTSDVELFFEVERLSSFDPKSEMMLSIMASLAQEESRNLSENIKWGIARKMEKGEFTLPYSRFLGYKKGRNGRPEIVRSEAKIVKRIYWLFLNGVSISRIAKILTGKGIPAPGGGKKWHYSTIKSILTNEKYKGEALLQKTYVEDYLTHKSVLNNRAIRQYYITDSHPAIISPEDWQKVQEKLRSKVEKMKI